MTRAAEPPESEVAPSRMRTTAPGPDKSLWKEILPFAILLTVSYGYSVICRVFGHHAVIGPEGGEIEMTPVVPILYFGPVSVMLAVAIRVMGYKAWNLRNACGFVGIVTGFFSTASIVDSITPGTSLGRYVARLSLSIGLAAVSLFAYRLLGLPAEDERSSVG